MMKKNKIIYFMLVNESLYEFLNEDLGTLKPFSDIPEEWKDRLLKTASWTGMGGENSKVMELSSDSDYKTLLKNLKDDNLIIAIIKKDGVSEYMIEKISPNKFKVRRAEGEYSIKQAKEQKAREDTQKSNESINPPKADEINERLRRSYYDSADVGDMSVPQLQEWLDHQKKENPNSKYQIFLIFADIERGKKRQGRMELRNIQDPLEVGQNYHEKTRSQKERYEIFSEKKRAQLDKQLDKVLDDFKQQLVNNFDKSIEKIVSDMRKGYSWNLDVKSIGEALLKDVNMAELKKFTAAYDAIGPYRDPDSVKAVKELKKLGF
jgi:hypothetical protein